ncbi:hypothetical protein MAR_029523, partial [Mya arenaria]
MDDPTVVNLANASAYLNNPETTAYEPYAYVNVPSGATGVLMVNFSKNTDMDVWVSRVMVRSDSNVSVSVHVLTDKTCTDPVDFAIAPTKIEHVTNSVNVNGYTVKGPVNVPLSTLTQDAPVFCGHRFSIEFSLELDAAL